MEHDRFEKQLQFIKEVDRLKRISRQTVLLDRSRQENSAEHSWHVAIMALVLSEYAINTPVDLLRVLKMLLIHDLVEIDAGDTFCYNEQECKDKALREQKAAERISYFMG
jgi:putative hydrolase of HD superfamily